jgi:septal ring factor EnvC (AmiA/AmiB activator)
MRRRQFAKPFNPLLANSNSCWIKKKPITPEREAQRRDVLVRLDNSNQNQNQVRKRLNQIAQSRQELNMAADNLSIEVQKQKESEAVSRQRLLLLLKYVDRVHRDGIVRFAMSGKDLGTMVKRARALYRTLRANSGVAQQMQARSRRLAESEMRLTEARQSMVQLENELREQEGLLGTFSIKRNESFANCKWIRNAITL